MESNEQPAPTRKRRGAYAKSAERRRDILAAARDVFAVNGYRSGSLREIAEIVGIDSSSIFHYFPTKSALLQAVLDDRDDLADRVLAEVEGDPMASFIRLAQQNESTPGLITLYTLLAAESATPGHPSAEYFTARYERVRGNFRAAFEQLQRDGLLREGVDPGYAGTSTLALWDGIQMQWMIDPGAVDVVATLRQHIGMLTTAPLPEG